MATDTPAPAAIPWWQSRIIWVQIVAALFAVASFFGLDLGAKLGMNEVQTVTAILGVIPVITMVIRIVNPTPTITGTKATAEAINAAAPTTNTFSGQALTESGPE